MFANDFGTEEFSCYFVLRLALVRLVWRTSFPCLNLLLHAIKNWISQIEASKNSRDATHSNRNVSWKMWSLMRLATWLGNLSWNCIYFKLKDHCILSQRTTVYFVCEVEVYYNILFCFWNISMHNSSHVFFWFVSLFFTFKTNFISLAKLIYGDPRVIWDIITKTGLSSSNTSSNALCPARPLFPRISLWAVRIAMFWIYISKGCKPSSPSKITSHGNGNI